MDPVPTALLLGLSRGGACGRRAEPGGRPFPLIPTQPVFKVFHYHPNSTEFLARHQGNVAKGLDDLKDNYWGIGLQSNFSAAFFREALVPGLDGGHGVKRTAGARTCESTG